MKHPIISTKRNLTKSQKVILLQKVEEQVRKEAKERQGTRTDLNIGSNLTQSSDTGRTAEIMAKKLGVSKNTYKDGIKIKKGEQIAHP